MLVRKSLSQQKNHSHCIRALAGLSPLHHSTNQGARAKQVDPEANRGTWRQTGRSQDRARSNNRSTEPESQRLWAQEPIDTDRGQAKREGRQRLRQHWARRSSERRRNFAKICKLYGGIIVDRKFVIPFWSRKFGCEFKEERSWLAWENLDDF